MSIETGGARGHDYRSYLIDAGVEPKQELIDRMLSMERHLQRALPSIQTSLSWLHVRPAILTEINCRELGIDFCRASLFKALDGYLVQKNPIIPTAEITIQPPRKIKAISNDDYCHYMVICRGALRISVSPEKTFNLLSFKYGKDLSEQAKDIYEKFQAHQSSQNKAMLASCSSEKTVYICASLYLAAQMQHVRHQSIQLYLQKYNFRDDDTCRCYLGVDRRGSAD